MKILPNLAQARRVSVHPAKWSRSFRKPQAETQNTGTELASQNVALKEQMAAKELSWEQEKKKTDEGSGVSKSQFVEHLHKQ